MDSSQVTSGIIGKECKGGAFLECTSLKEEKGHTDRGKKKRGKRGNSSNPREARTKKREKSWRNI